MPYWTQKNNFECIKIKMYKEKTVIVLENNIKYPSNFVIGEDSLNKSQKCKP